MTATTETAPTRINVSKSEANSVNRAIAGLVRLENQRRRQRQLKVFVAVIAIGLLVSISYLVMNWLTGFNPLNTLLTLIKAKFAKSQ
jgi:hypothetical protein